MGSVVGRLFVKALGWLLVLLPTWLVVAGVFAAPAGLLAGQAMTMGFPFWVRGASRDGGTLILDTWLGVTAANGQPGYLVAEADFLLYGYGTPLLAALLLASGARRALPKAALGALCLLPFQAFGVAMDWLRQSVLTAGPQVASQVAFDPIQRELVALGYQFGVLVLPALAPVLLWLALDRRFIATLLLEAELTRAGR